MTATIIEGFDWLTTTTGSNTNFISTMSRDGWFVSYMSPKNDFSAISVETGRFGFGKAVRFDYDSTSGGTCAGIVKYIGSSETEGIICVSMKVNTTGDDPNGPGSVGGPGVIFQNSAHPNAVHIAVSFEYAGRIRVMRNTSTNTTSFTGTVIGTSDPDSYTLDAYFNLQVRTVVDPVAGEVEIKINDKVVLHIVDENTTCSVPGVPAEFDFAGFGCIGRGGISADASFDDFYFLNMDGAVNNDFLGNLRVKSQFAIADGTTINSSIGGTSPAATHWQSVINTALDDTKYVYEPTLGEFDLYSMDPNLETGNVHALQVRLVARQDDATQMGVSAKVRTGGSNYVGDLTFNLNQTYTHYNTIFELNPNTGVGWTSAEVNAAQIGFEVVTPEA